MCRTSTFGLFLLTVLNVYGNETNETELVSNVTNTEHRVLTRSTWLRGSELCREVYNMTMASAEDIRNRKTNLTVENNLLEKLPIWTYAFEVTDKTTGHTLRINHNDATLYNNAYQCLLPNGTKLMECCESLTDGDNRCREYGAKLHLPAIQPTNVATFINSNWTTVSRWVKLRNESEFLSESGNLSVRCLLLTENGTLRTDDCEANHSTLCLGGNTQQVVTYVDKDMLPPYAKATTTRGSSITTSNSSSPTRTSSKDIKSTTTTGPPVTTSSTDTKSTVTTGPPVTTISTSSKHSTSSRIMASTTRGPSVTITYFTSRPSTTTFRYISTGFKFNTISVTEETKKESSVGVTVLLVAVLLVLLLILVVNVFYLFIYKRKHGHKGSDEHAPGVPSACRGSRRNERDHSKVPNIYDEIKDGDVDDYITPESEVGPTQDRHGYLTFGNRGESTVRYYKLRDSQIKEYTGLSNPS